MTLSPEQRERYRADGVLFPLTAVASARAERCREAVEELGRDSDALRRLDNAHLFFAWAYDLATAPAVLDAVEAIIGQDILIDGTLIFCKPARDPGYVSWHQDSVYSGWHLTPSVSAWIALTPSTPQNGCMRVIPGSHRRGVLEHVTAVDDANLLRRGERIRAGVDESAAVDLALRPGEMSLHDSNIVHGSRANGSKDSRVGFIVRFVTSRVRSAGRPFVRARGAGDCDHLELAARPRAVAPERALAAWREFTAARRD